MGRAASLTLAAASLVIAGAHGGCTHRAQAIVVVDADMPIPADVAADPTISAATSFDRIEVATLAEDGTADSAIGDGKQLFLVGGSAPWPITFGVKDGFARLRIRAYRGAHANRGASGLTEPSPRVVVERLAFIDVPGSGRHMYRVVLHGECLGAPADARAATTCVDDPRAPAPAASAVEELDYEAALPARPPLWARAHEVPCTGTAPKDALCIPGGTFVRGDAASADIAPTSGYLPTPLLAATLSPFFMDRTEVTVARYRALLAKGALAGAALPEQSTLCTWSDDVATAENLPLTCVTAATARAVCKSSGGDLPSEAQWEYAARGRDRASTYPWGDADPACCSARIGDALGCSTGTLRPSPVGSHGDPAKCGGIVDASRDGILDLAGNARERVLDTSRPYDDPSCAPPGVATDPVCLGQGAAPGAARGGSFRSTSFYEVLASARTREDLRSDDLGFRCVYRGAP